jgi:repressor LexA
MKNITAQKIKEAREKRGWNQKYLAELLGFPDSSYISRIENGKRNVTNEELVLFADKFCCDVHDLIGLPASGNVRNALSLYDLLEKVKQGLPFSFEEEEFLSLIQSPGRVSPKKTAIPILGNIRVGLPILSEENIEGYLDVPDYMRADYVLIVRNDSMIGVGILEDDYVICRENQVANSGQIVVALNDLSTGFSEATLKYYYDNGDGSDPLLRTANPNYPQTVIKQGYRIAGVMVALVRREAPVYQVYKNYITVPRHDEWTEVIDSAISKGMQPQQLLDIIDMRWQMIQRFNTKKR